MSPEFVGLLVLGLTQLSSLALTLRKLSGRAETREISPQPLQVVAAQAHAHTDKTLCDERHKEISRRFEEMDMDRREVRVSLAKIHNRINDLVEVLGRLGAKK